MLEKIGCQQKNTKNATFSIIIPTSTNREEFIHRTLRSVLNQTYPPELFEIIIVIDGHRSKEQLITEQIKTYTDPRIKIAAIHDLRYERCISRNDGMKAATGDWICWLDSDDEYMTCYLDRMSWAINEYPDYKVFNFGAIVIREKNMTIRPPYDLGPTEMLTDFVSGKIGSGSFIFKRELLDDPDVGYLPSVMNCYALADAAKIPGYNSKDKTLGNPWGDDAYLFWKLAKKYKSKKLDFFPYINYIRRQYNAPFYWMPEVPKKEEPKK